MILPTKHLSIDNSLLGTGAKLLDELKIPSTVSSLWERSRPFPEIKSFEQYVLGLTFLYSMGVIELEKGLIRRVH